MEGDKEDAGDGIRWTTYTELGRIKGINKTSAARLAFRHGWPRKLGIDGQSLVAVPALAQVTSNDSTPDASADDMDADGPGGRDGIMGSDTPEKLHEEALARERHRAAQAEVRADRAEAAVDAAWVRVEQLSAERDQVRQERDYSRVRVASAEGEANALREALERARRPGRRRWLGL